MYENSFKIFVQDNLCMKKSRIQSSKQKYYFGFYFMNIFR